MDPMVIGRTIMKKASAVSTYYTHWQPREGNSGTFSMEIVQGILGENLTMTVQTKTSEEADSSAADLGNVSGTSAVKSVNVSSCKDLVRCKITTANSAATGGYFIRVLQTQWEYN